MRASTDDKSIIFEQDLEIRIFDSVASLVQESSTFYGPILTEARVKIFGRLPRTHSFSCKRVLQKTQPIWQSN